MPCLHPIHVARIQVVSTYIRMLWLVRDRSSGTVYIPAPLHDMNSIYSFRKQSKTYLFSDYICALQILLLAYLLTYLLTSCSSGTLVSGYNVMYLV